MMHRLAIKIVSAAALCCATPIATSAAPIDGLGIGGDASELSPTQDSRWFCANRATGRFLHWGRCGGPTYRVYCRNRFTGRFLHWGFC